MTSTLPPLVQAFSGAIGSASANILTYPLDLVTTRVQLDPPGKNRKYRGFARPIHLLRNIARRDGIVALYGGIATDTGATILSSFLYFYVYSFLRLLVTKRLLPSQPTSGAGKASMYKPSIVGELVLGFIAGVFSRAISTPLNMITLRLQAEETANGDIDEDNEAASSRGSGVVGTARSIYREHGLMGFWRGFQTTVILSLNPSITLAFFQLFRRLLYLFERKLSFVKSNASKQVDPTPGQAFFGAAFSNSIAVCVLYPLILAKTRLQASSVTSLQKVIQDAYNGVDTSHKVRGTRTQDATVGVSGLYRGLWLQIVKGFLNQGVTFTMKRRIEEMIINVYLRRRRCT